MTTRRERGVNRVLEKLEASINAGQYYEAHQMYRTLYFRYLNQKMYPQLLQLLYEGSSLLLDKDQQGSGADLGLLFLEVLTKSKTRPCEVWIVKVANLFKKIKSNMPDRDHFLIAAVKWSMDESNRGHPLLHQKIAEIYWQEKKYTLAHRHFLHANDGTAFATMLVELHTSRGLKSETDMFIAQPVLQFLCLKNMEMATETFNEYTASHPTIKNGKGPPYPYPLLNFLWFLFQAIERNHATQFKILRRWYEVTIRRDPNYLDYLDIIGCAWFDIASPVDNNRKNAMLGLFKSMMGDESSDEEGGKPSNKVAAYELD